MNRKNYQRELEKVIEEVERSGRVPRLLLHSCCAPCSSYVLEYLSRYFDITVFYYNPNIYPPAEYEQREREQERLLQRMPLPRPVKFLAGEYRPEEFYGAVKGLEREPEGGRRCAKCFRLRLLRAAEAAKAGCFDYFTTTLTISPLKDAERLNALGDEIGNALLVPFLHSDFKKKDGYRRSVELSARYGLYRQDYCGCVFSMDSEKAPKSPCLDSEKAPQIPLP